MSGCLGAGCKYSIANKSCERPECNLDLTTRLVHKPIDPAKASLLLDSVSPQPANPKALTAAKKLPLLSVLSTASIIHEAAALQFGAFDAPKVDGTTGYGPFNYRDPPVEIMTYIDAAMRHIFKYVDGEEYDPDTSGRVHHLGLAKATLGILLDAMEHENLIDNRPGVRNGVASKLLAKLKR